MWPVGMAGIYNIDLGWLTSETVEYLTGHEKYICFLYKDFFNHL